MVIGKGRLGRSEKHKRVKGKKKNQLFLGLLLLDRGNRCKGILHAVLVESKHCEAVKKVISTPMEARRLST